MPNDLVLVAALLAPLLALTILRINAAMVFLSLCLGYVLVIFVTNDADSLISFIAPDVNSVSAATLKLGMLLTPVVLTSIFTLFSIHGRVKTLVNVLPAAGVSIFGLLLAVPLFTPGLRYTIQSQSFWQEVSQAQAMAVGVTAFVSLLFLWAQRRHGERGGKHRR